MGTDSAHNPPSAPLRYGLPLAAILVLLLLCRELSGFANSAVVYILSSAVVSSSAWYFGVGSAIAPVILTVAGVGDWFVAPGFPFHVTNVAQAVALLTFLFTSVIVMTGAEGRRRQNLRLQKEHAELEGRVKKRTAELDAANHNLRQLSARLIEMQDDERRRIARELHDSVGQLLVGLSMNLSTVFAEIERLTKTASVLRDSEALVQEMSRDVRTISHLLHPPLLDELGLGSAIRWYIDGFAQRSNIKVDLDCPDDFGRLPRDMETAIFRMVQECLTNVHRHSESQSAKIRCHRSGSQVLIEVEDGGKGIPAEKLSSMASTGTPGVGIRGMRERLRQLGGDLGVKSDSNGTVVTARVPALGTSRDEDSSSVAGTSKAAA